jgi:hypothetical protein
MSKRCILKLFEKNGRGQSGLAAALRPGAERCKRDAPLGVRRFPRDHNFSSTEFTVGAFPS